MYLEFILIKQFFENYYRKSMVWKIPLYPRCLDIKELQQGMIVNIVQPWKCPVDSWAIMHVVGSRYIWDFFIVNLKWQKINIESKIISIIINLSNNVLQKMSLDLVARARSMDGSADLKWRNADHSLAYHIGGPRSGAEGRSLDWSTSKGRGKKRQRFVSS